MVRATITPTSTALTIANAIASSSVTVTGASFVAIPPSGTPNGISTSVLGGFPLDGADYGILTSGDVSSVDQPGTFADTSDGGPNVRGNSDLDVSILKIDLTIPQGANCLTFNFVFLSEEFPVFVGTAYNDAFIAELDTSDWTTSGSTITAAHNFAFDAANDVVSINSTGLGGMTPAGGTGTAYDGTAGPGPDTNGAATALLGAATPVTAGAHSLYLSLFDQGDHALDSAVFLDNLRAGSVADPAADCKPGATEAARLTLVKTVDNTGGGTALVTDWTLSATGPTTISGHTGDAAITNAAVNPGTYALAETGGPTGYSAGAWSCSGGTLTGSSLVLAAGETASCSITNTFGVVPPNPAHLTLAKTVDNTGGGTALVTDWTLSATGPTPITGKTGDASITNAAVNPGTYALAETGGPTGYSAGAWSCTAGTLTGSSLVLAAGETASCSITNTFTPPVRPGLIAPSETTCQQYVAGTASTLPGVNYSDKDGTIGQNINPGIFFYLSTVTVTAGQTVTTSQTTTSSSGALFLLNQGHAFIWDSNCHKVGNMASANGGATGSFTFATGGTYILQLQYLTKSLAQTAAPSPINPTYTFDTEINGVEVVSDTTSIGLVKT